MFRSLIVSSSLLISTQLYSQGNYQYSNLPNQNAFTLAIPPSVSQTPESQSLDRTRDITTDYQPKTEKVVDSVLTPTYYDPNVLAVDINRNHNYASNRNLAQYNERQWNRELASRWSSNN